MLLQKVAGELVGVEKHKKTDVASEEAPEVTLNKMCPHLKTVRELLPTLITFCLLSLGRFGHFPGLLCLVFSRLGGWK